MLSFESGEPIAIVKGGEFDKQIIYINEEDDYKQSDSDNDSDYKDYIKKNKKYYNKNNVNNKKEFHINDGGKIKPLPDFKNTQRIFISGSTGCGKSYYIRKWLKLYLLVFPERIIYLFSDKKHDESLDTFKNIRRVQIDDDLKKKKPIEPEKFKDSVVIFDDIDSIQDKKLYAIILSLQTSILNRGRSEGITCICTSHLMNNGQTTKAIYNSCQIIAFPLRGANYYALNYCLKNYIGLDSKQIKVISQLPSRMCTLFKNYPSYVLYDKGIYLL